MPRRTGRECQAGRSLGLAAPRLDVERVRVVRGEQRDRQVLRLRERGHDLCVVGLVSDRAIDIRRMRPCTSRKLVV